MLATIRRARLADADRLGEVNVAAWRWAYKGHLPDELLANVRAERRADWWRGWLTGSSDDDFAAWVAEVHGEIVGYAATSRARDDDLREGTAELLMLYLLEEHVGRGIGSALIEAAEGHMRVGYERAALWVLVSNDLARAFYERHGWQPDGTTREHPAGKETRPEMRYAKSLA